MIFFKNILIVGLGGFLGSSARYIIYRLLDKRFNSLYPWTTFIVNITGSLILGLLLGLMIRSSLSTGNLRLLLVTGFCASFTTFSTFAYENVFLLEQKALPTALLYTATSLIFGFLAVFAGYYLGKSLG